MIGLDCQWWWSGGLVRRITFRTENNVGGAKAHNRSYRSTAISKPKRPFSLNLCVHFFLINDTLAPPSSPVLPLLSLFAPYYYGRVIKLHGATLSSGEYTSSYPRLWGAGMGGNCKRPEGSVHKLSEGSDYLTNHYKCLARTFWHDLDLFRTLSHHAFAKGTKEEGAKRLEPEASAYNNHPETGHACNLHTVTCFSQLGGYFERLVAAIAPPTVRNVVFIFTRTWWGKHEVRGLARAVLYSYSTLHVSLFICWPGA
jgi:hypothetical protein